MKKAVFVLLCLVMIKPVYGLSLDDIYNEQQLKILRGAAEIINASAGYDEIRKIVYVTFWGNQGIDRKKQDEFNSYVSGFYAVNSADVIRIYERLLFSKYLMEYMAEKERRNKNWKLYYYYSDSLLPGTTQFLDILLQAIAANDPQYAQQHDKRAVSLQRYAVDIARYWETIYGGGL